MAAPTRPHADRSSSPAAPPSPEPTARTAIGRARGRHRALLIAACVALIASTIADAATGYDGPGPFVYPVFALAVALIPWRYTPLAATAMSVFFIVGGLASPAFVRWLTTPSRAVDFTAGWAQLAGFAAAAVCAAAAVVCAPRSTSRRRPAPDPS